MPGVSPEARASESSTRALYLPEVNVNWATELPSPEQGFSFSGKCLRSSRKGLNSDWHPLPPPPPPIGTLDAAEHGPAGGRGRNPRPPWEEAALSRVSWAMFISQTIISGKYTCYMHNVSPFSFTIIQAMPVMRLSPKEQTTGHAPSNSPECWVLLV